MSRYARWICVTALGLASSALAAEPEDLGARPSVPPARTAFDQDGPPIGRSDSLVQRNQLRILDPGPSLMDPPRSRESWQSLVERDLDRVMGRIEPETLHQLRRLEQDRAAREGIDSQRESERFLEERDRSLRLEQRDREQTHSIQRRRVVERESDRLRAERERFQRALSGGNPGAVAADTRRLEQLRAAHEAALTTIESERAKALSTTDADTTLTPQQRTDNRAAANARFDRLRDQRTSEYESARSRITGFAGEKGD